MEEPQFPSENSGSSKTMRVFYRPEMENLDYCSSRLVRLIIQNNTSAVYRGEYGFEKISCLLHKKRRKKPEFPVGNSGSRGRPYGCSSLK
jgi:hypothetical protein